jgi:hypothetical protein
LVPPVCLDFGVLGGKVGGRGGADEWLAGKIDDHEWVGFLVRRRAGDVAHRVRAPFLAGARIKGESHRFLVRSDAVLRTDELVSKPVLRSVQG